MTSRDSEKVGNQWTHNGLHVLSGNSVSRPRSTRATKLRRRPSTIIIPAPIRPTQVLRSRRQLNPTQTSYLDITFDRGSKINSTTNQTLVNSTPNTLLISMYKYRINSRSYQSLYYGRFWDTVRYFNINQGNSTGYLNR